MEWMVFALVALVVVLVVFNLDTVTFRFKKSPQFPKGGKGNGKKQLKP